MEPIFDGYTCPDDEVGWDEVGWDEVGWDKVGWDEAAPWSVPAGTPPCPEGNPQRLLEILGFRMKSPDLLQLRAVLSRSEGGCVPVIDEQPDCVRVRLVACWDPYEVPSHHSLIDVHRTDCPFRIWLDAPLGPRPVFDLDTGEELALFLPCRQLGEHSRYVPRPPGDVWPPLYLEDFEANGS